MSRVTRPPLSPSTAETYPLPPTAPAEDRSEATTPELPVVVAVTPGIAPASLFTMEQLQLIVREAVAAAVGASQVPASLGADIGAAVAAGIAANTRKKVTFAEYDPKTVWVPNKKTDLKLTRPYFQNGSKMEPTQLFQREKALLERITHSGRYINRLCEVIVTMDGSQESVNLRYHNKTADQRFENARHWRDLTHMLEQVVEAQEREDTEAAETKLATEELRRMGQDALARRRSATATEAVPA